MANQALYLVDLNTWEILLDVFSNYS